MPTPKQPPPGKPVTKEVATVKEPVKELSDNELAEQTLLAKLERLKKMPDHPQVTAAIQRTELYLENIRQRINEE